MNKKDIKEVKKCFNKKDPSLDRFRFCYVNGEKEKLADFRDFFTGIDDEEMHKYCDIFKKSLSGRIAKNLFNIEFPRSEEEEGGRQNILFKLNKTELKDDSLVESFYDEIIENYDIAGNFLILLAHGNYDIPGKSSDGSVIEDASEYVYSFIIVSICPVELLREGLCFDEMEKKFITKCDNWGVKRPETAILFPSFNDRLPDIHECLYYSKNPKERQEEFAEKITGTSLPIKELDEKNLFNSIIMDSLGRDCDFEKVKNISESLSLIKDKKEESEDENITIEKSDITYALSESGIDEEQIEKFEEIYDELASSTHSFNADNVIMSKNMEIKSDLLSIKLKPGMADIIESKVIDGREYLLIPVSDAIELNGIKLCEQRVREDE